MSANDAPIFPDEVVDIILEYLLDDECYSLAQLSHSLAAARDSRLLTECSSGPYHAKAWTDGFETLATPLATCRSWRRRCLEMLMQRVLICDADWDTYNCDLTRFDRLCETTKDLPRDIAPVSHIRHLAFGCNQGVTSGACWDYWDLTDHLEDQLPEDDWEDGEEPPAWCTGETEIETANKVLRHMPSTLASLRWCSPLPVEKELAQILAGLPLTDVFISSEHYYWGK